MTGTKKEPRFIGKQSIHTCIHAYMHIYKGGVAYYKSTTVTGTKKEPRFIGKQSIDTYIYAYMHICICIYIYIHPRMAEASGIFTTTGRILFYNS